MKMREKIMKFGKVEIHTGAGLPEMRKRLEVPSDYTMEVIFTGLPPSDTCKRVECLNVLSQTIWERAQATGQDQYCQECVDNALADIMVTALRRQGR